MESPDQLSMRLRMSRVRKGSPLLTPHGLWLLLSVSYLTFSRPQPRVLSLAFWRLERAWWRGSMIKRVQPITAPKTS